MKVILNSIYQVINGFLVFFFSPFPVENNKHLSIVRNFQTKNIEAPVQNNLSYTLTNNMVVFFFVENKSEPPPAYAEVFPGK